MPLITLSELVWIETVFIVIMIYKFAGNGEFVSNTDVIEGPVWLYSTTSNFETNYSVSSSSNSPHFRKSTFAAMNKKHKIHGKRNLIKNVKRFFKSTSMKNCTPFFIHYLQSTEEKITEQKLNLSQLTSSTLEITTNNSKKLREKQRGKLKNFFFPTSSPTTFLSINDSELLNSEDEGVINSTLVNNLKTIIVNNTSSVPTYKTYKKSKMKYKHCRTRSHFLNGIPSVLYESEDRSNPSTSMKEQSTITNSNLTSSRPLKNEDAISSRSFWKKMFMPKKSGKSKLDDPAADVNTRGNPFLERNSFDKQTSSCETQSTKELKVEGSVCENNPTEAFSVTNSRKVNGVSQFKFLKTTVDEGTRVSKNYITIFPDQTKSLSSLNRYSQGNSDGGMVSKNNKEANSEIDDENYTDFSSSSERCSPYKKVKFKDLFNFYEPTVKIISSPKKQKHVNTYKTSRSVFYHTNKSATTGGLEAMSETPISDQLRSSTDKCVDTDLITPDSSYRGIIIKPQVSSNDKNKNNAVTNKLDIDVIDVNSSTTEGKNHTIPSYLVNFRRLFHSKQEYSVCKNGKVNRKHYSSVLIPDSSESSSNAVEVDVTKDFNKQPTVTSSDFSSLRKFHFMDIFNFKKPTSIKCLETKQSLLVNGGGSATSSKCIKTTNVVTTDEKNSTTQSSTGKKQSYEFENILCKKSNVPEKNELFSLNGAKEADITTRASLDSTTNLYESQVLPTPHLNKFSEPSTKLDFNSEIENSSEVTVSFSTLKNVIHLKNMLSFKKKTTQQHYWSQSKSTTDLVNNFSGSNFYQNQEQGNKSNDSLSTESMEKSNVLDRPSFKLKDLINFRKQIPSTKAFKKIESADYDSDIPGVTKTPHTFSHTLANNIGELDNSSINGASKISETQPVTFSKKSKLKNLFNFHRTSTIDQRFLFDKFTEQKIKPNIETDEVGYPQQNQKENTTTAFDQYNDSDSYHMLEQSDCSMTELVQNWSLSKKKETDNIATSFLHIKFLRRKNKPDKIVETEEGNIFKWIFRTSRSADQTNPITVRKDTSFSTSQKSTFPTESVEETSSVSLDFRKRVKNMFSFKDTSTNITENTSSVNYSFTSRTKPVSNTSTEQSEVLPKDRSKYPERRNKINSPIKIRKDNSTAKKVHNPFEKRLTPSTINNKGNVSEFNIKSINNILKNMTRHTNSTFIMYPDYVEYLTLNKKRKQFKNSKFNKTFFKNNVTSTNDTSFSFMYYVMKPFEKLVSVFRASPTNFTEIGNINGSDLTNGSFPGHLHPPNDSVILVSQDRSRNVTDAMHESNVGLLNMIRGWFLCLFDPFIEPKPRDIRFYLYTRNNTEIREELFLNEQEEEYNDVNNTELPEPILEKEASLGTKRRKRQLEQVYNFEPLDPAKSEVQSKWFNVFSDTKVLVHGFTQDSLTDIMVRMKDAYLTKAAFNVILVDWSSVGDDLCYPHVAKAVRSVGAIVAQLLDALIEGGVSPTQVHVVGFSLGAHVAGHAGTRIKHGLISRISV